MSALQNKFSITLPVTKKDIDLRVQTISGLDLIIKVIDVPFQGTVHHIPSENIEYDPITLSVVLDNDFGIYKSIVKELQTMADISTNEFNDAERFDATITIYSLKNHKLFEIVLKDAWINSVTGVSFDTTTDGTKLDLELSVVYSYFEIKE